jgi:hypothetical protein
MKHSHIHPHTAAYRQGIGHFVPCCSLLVALMASACATSDEPAATQPGAAGSGPSLTDTVGRLIDSTEVCTQPRTMCANLQIPSDMAGVPAAIQFAIYDSPEAPTHPPNAYAGLFPSPQVVAGETQKFELTDGGLEGDYWLFAIMYMPGGHPFEFPTVDLDYVQVGSAPALPLDGSALNLDAALVLVRAQ